MTTSLVEQADASTSAGALPWRVGDAIDARAFAHIRRRMLLDHCKWDPQVSDVSTLTPFPLILQRSHWHGLAHDAEQLAAEVVAAEGEIRQSSRLLKLLCLPRAARRTLLHAPIQAAPVRVMRFDFHWTTTGWQISEVNSDVPGGFTESSSFTQLVAEHYTDASPAGDPVNALTRAIRGAIPTNGAVALISAVGYLEDQQVIAYLAKRLTEKGVDAITARPADIDWRGPKPRCFGREVDGLVRFFQAEWLAARGRRNQWAQIATASIPVFNPLISIISESKRFPLAWDSLRTPMRAWRRLLPRTVDPLQIDSCEAGDYVFKPAFCNTGDAVLSQIWMPRAKWNLNRWRIALQHRSWIAQRRFDCVAADTPLGPMFPCIGVYTVNGKAAGIYGRLSRGRVVDFAASDVAVLVES